MTAIVLTANLASVALCIALFLTGQAGRWKSLFFYLYLIPIQGAWDATAVYACHAMGLALAGHYVFEAGLYACQAWMIVEIAQSCAGVTEWMRRGLGRFVRRLCAVAFVVWLTFEFMQRFDQPVTAVTAVTHVLRALSLTLLWTLCIVCAGLRTFRVAVPAETKAISIGLLVQLSASAVTSLLVQILGDGSGLGLIQACIWCAGLIPFAALLHSQHLPVLRIPLEGRTNV